MVKLKAPLLSLGARNTISKAITFVKRRGQHIAEKKPEILDVQSPAQLSWRHMYQKAIALWHALSAAEKQEWESLARPKHMTGFAWFMSQCLRPNPGIYLPLQGGTMSGDIDMAKNRILKLPLPADSQEPLTLAYHTANIAPYLYNEGARAYHSVHQTIPNAAATAIAFNSERWDTDSIHHLTVNNSRLTCKTAGKYVVHATLEWEGSNLSHREVYLKWNNAWNRAKEYRWSPPAFAFGMTISTLVDLAVNDYMEIIVYQATGAGLDIYYDPRFSPEFAMSRVGA